MSNFDVVRRLAREKNSAARSIINGGGVTTSLLSAAQTLGGFSVQIVPPEHPLLMGGDGALYPGDSPTVYVANDLDPAYQAYVTAHEFGHHWIEASLEPSFLPRGVDPGCAEEPTPLGLKRVEAYSAQELRERRANVFAREFLLPRDEAHRLFIDCGQTAETISRELTLPISLVYQQLAASLLLPDVHPVQPHKDHQESPPLDLSQKSAAEHMDGALLVEAGPGTGKTRTLIARIEYLLSKGVPPASILVLTFSNKAAQEIRERVAKNMPTAAADIWAGTFHGFGLELVRKFSNLIDVKEPVQLIDQARGLEILEQELPHLGLDYYLKLHEPLLDLRYVLSAISRAKDELFDPTQYLAAARQMQFDATNEEDRLKADKAVEVGTVFKHYEEKLHEYGAVDFADLINRSIEIFRKDPSALIQVQDQYQHVLVDEYQDVNRASALLLKEIVGDGSRLWVVGDAKQSIYRFRGASPVNTRNFEIDYPGGTRKALSVNYRSSSEIVELFSVFGNSMSVSKSRLELTANRGKKPNSIDFNLATDRDAEIAGLAKEIQEANARGYAYRDQAVLCRSHTNLERIALGLEAAGIPVLYLGDLFERPEIRDLLSLASFVAEPRRGGLYRIGAISRYRLSVADITAFLKFSDAESLTPLVALSRLGSVSDLSQEGRQSLSTLQHDLRNISFKTSPGEFLCSVLFNNRVLLDELLTDNSIPAQQRRIAIHQLIQFSIEFRTNLDGDPKKRMLSWIRRLEMFGDERSLRELPDAVTWIDAVRLMTVHGSKGLEFPIVHVPMLGAGIFPNSWRGERCPAPIGMLSSDAAEDHKHEEECLFFVALSRAKDRISLSRAVRYSEKRGSNASSVLKAISSLLPRSKDEGVTWESSLTPADKDISRTDLAVSGMQHDGRDIEIFLRCPRSYMYQVVLGLSSSREDNAYLRFHRTVYMVLREIPSRDKDTMLSQLDAYWVQIGPSDHPLSPLYKEAAMRILVQASSRPASGARISEELLVAIDSHTIKLSIDELEKRPNGETIIRRLRTGRPPKKADDRPLHALLSEAAKQNFGNSSHTEVHYLTTNEPIAVSLSETVMTSRLNDYRDAFEKLSGGNYPPEPENREDCPKCPHYFICPALAE